MGIALFQNCGAHKEQMSGSNEESLSSEQSSSLDVIADIDTEEESSVVEDPKVKEDPVTEDPAKEDPVSSEKYALDITLTKPVAEPSRLDWKFKTTFKDFIAYNENFSKSCEGRIKEFVAIPNKYSGIIYDEGLMPNDPMIEKMKTVKMAMEKNLNLAFCAYYAPTQKIRDNALNISAEYILRWNKEYVGDGNPINERYFVQLFIAADLLFPLLTKTDIATIRKLAARLDGKEKLFMANLKKKNPNDGRLKNNWKTRHLMVRIFANIITNSAANIKSLTTEINTDIASQYTTPKNFKLSSCSNLKAVGAYGSFDLQQRDAFVYHLSGISELAPLILLKSGIVNSTSKSKLLTAINLMKPYVLGTKKHPEFKCTTVQYDKDKIKIKPSLGADWDPHAARMLFRYGRVIWPETKSWTTRYLKTDEYAGWFRLIYTGKGDQDK